MDAQSSAIGVPSRTPLRRRLDKSVTHGSAATRKTFSQARPHAFSSAGYDRVHGSEPERHSNRRRERGAMRRGGSSSGSIFRRKISMRGSRSSSEGSGPTWRSDLRSRDMLEMERVSSSIRTRPTRIACRNEAALLGVSCFFSIQLVTSSSLMSTDTDGGSLHSRLRVGVGSSRRATHPRPLDDTDSRRLFLASCAALHLAFSTEWIVVTPRHDQPARGRPHHPVSFPIHPFGFPFKPFLSLLSKRLETWTVDETPLGTVIDESTTGSCFGKARRRSRHTCIFAP